MGKIKRMSVEIDIDLDDFDDDELKEELEERGFTVFEDGDEPDAFTIDRSDIEDIAYLIASGDNEHALRRIGDATNDLQIEPSARHMAKVRGK